MKGTTLEAGMHVPMIAYWPETIASGQVNSNLIDFTDFVPSLMDLAQAKLPTDYFTDGLSFFPQLKGEEGPVRDWVFCHYDPNWGKFEAKRFALDRQYKLYTDGNFYDFKDDPMEERPLDNATLDEVQRTVLAKLQGALKEFE